MLSVRRCSIRSLTYPVSSLEMADCGYGEDWPSPGVWGGHRREVGVAVKAPPEGPCAGLLSILSVGNTQTSHHEMHASE